MDAAHDRRHLGAVLLEAGLLTEAQLRTALAEQARTNRRLGEILVERGFLSGGAIANALAEQEGRALKTEYGFGTGLRSVLQSRQPGGASGAASAKPPQGRPHDGVALPMTPPPPRAPAVTPAPEPPPTAAPPSVAERDATIEALRAQVRTQQAELEQLRDQLARQSVAVPEPFAPQPLD